MSIPFIAASFSLALQVAPTTSSSTTPSATPASTPATATAGMVATRTQLKSGVGLTVVPLSASTPWSVAQLHVRLAPELRPDARAAATSWAHHLAQSGRRLLPGGSSVSVLVHADAVVVSFGVEGARLDDALKAVDAALRARSAKPSDSSRVDVLAVVDDAVGPAAAARLFAGDPRSLPVDGSSDAAALKLLGDAIDVGAVHVVVAGSDSDASLIARAQRAIGAPLPKRTPPSTTTTSASTTSTSTTTTSTTTTLESAALVARTTLLAPSTTPRAAVWVVAELLGARPLRAGLQHGVSVDGDDIAAVRARLLTLSDVDIAAARSRVVRSRAESLTSPAKLAYALGQAGLFDSTPNPITAVLGAVEAVNVDDVRAAAAALAAQAVVERAPRPPKAARSPASATTPSPASATTPSGAK